MNQKISLKYCSSTIAFFIYLKHVYGSWFKHVSGCFQPLTSLRIKKQAYALAGSGNIHVLWTHSSIYIFFKCRAVSQFKTINNLHLSCFIWPCSRKWPYTYRCVIDYTQLKGDKSNTLYETPQQKCLLKYNVWG